MEFLYATLYLCNHDIHVPDTLTQSWKCDKDYRVCKAMENSNY